MIYSVWYTFLNILLFPFMILRKKILCFLWTKLRFFLRWKCQCLVFHCVNVWPLYATAYFLTVVSSLHKNVRTIHTDFNLKFKDKELSAFSSFSLDMKLNDICMCCNFRLIWWIIAAVWRPRPMNTKKHKVAISVSEFGPIFELKLAKKKHLMFR